RPLGALAFTVIGVSLGTGITPEFVGDLASWPVSLAALCATVLVIMAATTLLLTRVFAQDLGTAILGTAPGALSYTLALAAEGRGRLETVLVLQTLRLVLLILGLPLILDAAGLAGGPAGGAGAAAPMSYLAAAGLTAGALALGWLMNRARVPGAYLFAGMGVSGLAHGAAIVPGALPPAVIFAAFAVTGAVVGARFAGIGRAALRRLAGMAMIVILTGSVIAAASAALIAGALGLDFGLVWVAFAPGGIEAMAAMALALGYDPAFVATHHLVRILFIILVLPLLLRALAPE
ncbi:MAG: AbrB family transcriptional regulator, partial [Pseudomonadota bacterium]